MNFRQSWRQSILGEIRRRSLGDRPWNFYPDISLIGLKDFDYSNLFKIPDGDAADPDFLENFGTFSHELTHWYQSIGSIYGIDNIIMEIAKSNAISLLLGIYKEHWHPQNPMGKFLPIADFAQTELQTILCRGELSSGGMVRYSGAPGVWEVLQYLLGFEGMLFHFEGLRPRPLSQIWTDVPWEKKICGNYWSVPLPLPVPNQESTQILFVPDCNRLNCAEPYAVSIGARALAESWGIAVEGVSRGGFLFCTDSKFSKELDAKVLSEHLRREFEKAGVLLSNNVAVLVEVKERAWLVVDENNGRKYSVRAENKRLNVFCEETAAFFEMVRKFADEEKYDNWGIHDYYSPFDYVCDHVDKKHQKHLLETFLVCADIALMYGGILESGVIDPDALIDFEQVREWFAPGRILDYQMPTGPIRTPAEIFAKAVKFVGNVEPLSDDPTMDLSRFMTDLIAAMGEEPMPDRIRRYLDRILVPFSKTYREKRHGFLGVSREFRLETDANTYRLNLCAQALRARLLFPDFLINIWSDKYRQRLNDQFRIPNVIDSGGEIVFTTITDNPFLMTQFQSQLLRNGHAVCPRAYLGFACQEKIRCKLEKQFLDTLPSDLSPDELEELRWSSLDPNECSDWDFCTKDTTCLIKSLYDYYQLKNWKPLLFPISLEFQRILDNEQISVLCKEFEYNEISLSQNTEVSIINYEIDSLGEVGQSILDESVRKQLQELQDYLRAEGRMWMITDHGNQKTYFVRKSEDRLNVYGEPNGN